MKEEAAKEDAPVALLPLTVEKPVYGGDFLSHLPASGGKAGKAVFVPLTLPGERIIAQITEEKRNFTKAEIAEIGVASPSRVQPLCRYFGVCGGCQYQHAEYETQLALKKQVLRETLARSGVAVPKEFALLAGEPWGYRNRIRLALVNAEASLQMGYRGRASHDLVPIEECPIAAVGLLDAANVIREFLSERHEPVTISEIELFTNQDGSGLLVTLFCKDLAGEVAAQRWLNELLRHLPEGAGLRLQVADGSLNPPLLGANGPSDLLYQVGGLNYSVEQGAFFQVNRWLVDALLALVTAGKRGKTAWDLYAGVGLFARRLTESFDSVVAVESATASIVALKRNLNGGHGRAVAATTLEFLRRNRAQREPGPDFMVLDPPRAGLGDEVTSLLNAIGSPRLVYVSCDPATLARDLKALTSERYWVDTVTMVDMFPQTFHIETVVELGRA